MLRELTSPLSAVGHAAVSFLYPPVCCLCGRPLTGHALPAGDESLAVRLCPGCVESVAPPIDHRCARCSAPVGPYLDTTHGCIHCRDDRFAFERIFSLGVYDGALAKACRLAKDQGEAPLTAALAELLWRRERESLVQESVAVVVPVPHHWTERLTRRHMPPVTLAAALARRLKAKLDTHILAKARRTPAQTSLPPARRRLNLRNTFRATGRLSTALTVLLVDDVLTTGTTAHRAAQALKEAGAGRIVVTVAARGIGRGAGQPA